MLSVYKSISSMALLMFSNAIRCSKNCCVSIVALLTIIGDKYVTPDSRLLVQGERWYYIVKAYFSIINRPLCILYLILNLSSISVREGKSCFSR